MGTQNEKRIASRDERQRAVYRWVVDTFGTDNAIVSERVRRLVEEVIELAQVENMSVEQLHATVAHVYAKPPGEAYQEVGGIGVSLLAYCSAKGLSADFEENAEAQRIFAVDPEHFRERHNRKADAGIAVRCPTRR